MAQAAFAIETPATDPIRAYVATLCKEEFEKLYTDYQELRRKQFLEPEKKLTAKDKYLTRQKLADLFAVSLPTVDNWVKTGLIPAMRIGSRVFFNRFDVEDAMAKIKSDKFYNRQSQG